MHVHLIPKRLKEQVKTINNPREDGGGLFFLARKEIILDTFKYFLKSTSGDESNKLITAINNATKGRVKRNAKILKENFEKIWKSDNKSLQRMAYSPR
jgi:hypothetical protein